MDGQPARRGWSKIELTGPAAGCPVPIRIVIDNRLGRTAKMQKLIKALLLTCFVVLLFASCTLIFLCHQGINRLEDQTKDFKDRLSYLERQLYKLRKYQPDGISSYQLDELNKRIDGLALNIELLSYDIKILAVEVEHRADAE
jgi:hypothetical protein